MKTWYAQQAFKIESLPIEAGEVLGKGEGEQFTPSDRLKSVVAWGHIEARVNYGLVADKAPPKPDKKPAKKKPDPGSAGADPAE